jgi:hypothetical protein
VPTHALAWHKPVAQARPHAPQLSGSLVVSMQTPPQSASGSEHNGGSGCVGEIGVVGPIGITGCVVWFGCMSLPEPVMVHTPPTSSKPALHGSSTSDAQPATHNASRARRVTVAPPGAARGR